MKQIRGGEKKGKNIHTSLDSLSASFLLLIFVACYSKKKERQEVFLKALENVMRPKEQLFSFRYGPSAPSLFCSREIGDSTKKYFLLLILF